MPNACSAASGPPGIYRMALLVKFSGKRSARRCSAGRRSHCLSPAGQSMEIDLACGGVNLTGWLPQVQPDGLLRWRPSLLSVSQGCNFGWNTLSTAPAVVMVKVAFFCKDGEWRFPPLAPAGAGITLTSWWMAIAGDVRAAAVLPESGGAWLKACYDAQNDAIWMDEETLQKARTKFLQAYEGT